jgi:hypothetical protein
MLKTFRPFDKSKNNDAVMDYGDVVESLFDVTACYFPITFKPPPNDPYGVTSEELVMSYLQLICGRFTHCMPPATGSSRVISVVAYF